MPPWKIVNLWLRLKHVCKKCILNQYSSEIQNDKYASITWFFKGTYDTMVLLFDPHPNVVVCFSPLCYIVFAILHF